MADLSAILSAIRLPSAEALREGVYLFACPNHTHSGTPRPAKLSISDIQVEPALRAKSLLTEAKTESEKQIQEIASKDGYSVELEYAPAAAFTCGS